MGKKNKKKNIEQTVMLIVACLILLLVVFLVYKNFIIDSSKPFLFVEEVDNNKMSDGNFDADAFNQDPKWKKFKKYGDWPVKPADTGKPNPFLPFFGAE